MCTSILWPKTPCSLSPAYSLNYKELADAFDSWQYEGLDDFGSQLGKAFESSVQGGQGKLFALLQGGREHPGDSGLDVVGAGVEVLADLSHEARGKVA